MDTSTSRSDATGPPCRQRAAVACAYCRSRRIKCRVVGGQVKCEQCLHNNVDCVFYQDIASVRSAPPAAATLIGPPKPFASGHGEERLDDVPQISEQAYAWESGLSGNPANGTSLHFGGRPKSPFRSRFSKSYGNGNAAVSAHPNGEGERFNRTFASPLSRQSRIKYPKSPTSSPTDSSASASSDELVEKLIATSGRLGFDNIAGTTRYFGPTTNLHVWDPNDTPTAHEQLRPKRNTVKAVSELSVDTYDHLMECFFRDHNSIFKMVEREEFTRDKENGRSQFFSGLLQICMLALGFRFADKSRPDMRKLTLADSPRESTLHREAKKMVEYDLEHLAGIPSVQALLLLGDLECGCGRDNTGWMFGGMACRLCFDMGLNRDCSELGLSREEMKVRQTVLRACIIYDEYWALYLGRLTSMKMSDIDSRQLPFRSDKSSVHHSNGDTKPIEIMTFEALLSLMDIASKITTENVTDAISLSIHQTCLRVAALDRELKDWHAELPSRLLWTPNNITNAESAFFLLHQQYHTALTLVHRPVAHLKRSPSPKDGDDAVNILRSAAEISLSVYLENATRIACALKQHRKRFESARFCLNTLHHIGTAATAFIFGITLPEGTTQRADLLENLDFLTHVLAEMSATYSPAERMFRLLANILNDFEDNGAGHKQRETVLVRPSIPARRPSSAVGGGDRTRLKRRYIDDVNMQPSRYINGGFMPEEPSANSLEAMAQVGGLDFESAYPPVDFRVGTLNPFNSMGSLEGMNVAVSEFHDFVHIDETDSNLPELR